MYPICYVILILIPLLIINKKIASLFYPYILLTSIIGIILNIILLFYKPLRKEFYKIFPKAVSLKYSPGIKIMAYLFIIFIKLLMIYIWPKNLSYNAWLVSTMLFLFYIIHYLLLQKFS